MTDENTVIERRCFRCDKQICGARNGVPAQAFREPPDSATCWTTTGNYGSTMFDSDKWCLEITVCDECLMERKPVVTMFRCRQERVTLDVQPWNGDE